MRIASQDSSGPHLNLPARTLVHPMLLLRTERIMPDQQHLSLRQQTICTLGTLALIREEIANPILGHWV